MPTTASGQPGRSRQERGLLTSNTYGCFFCALGAGNVCIHLTTRSCSPAPTALRSAFVMSKEDFGIGLLGFCVRKDFPLRRPFRMMVQTLIESNIIKLHNDSCASYSFSTQHIEAAQVNLLPAFHVLLAGSLVSIVTLLLELLCARSRVHVARIWISIGTTTLYFKERICFSHVLASLWSGKTLSKHSSASWHSHTPLHTKVSKVFLCYG